jgi:hypothetical protein
MEGTRMKTFHHTKPTCASTMNTPTNQTNRPAVAAVAKARSLPFESVALERSRVVSVVCSRFRFEFEERRQAYVVGLQKTSSSLHR